MIFEASEIGATPTSGVYTAFQSLGDIVWHDMPGEASEFMVLRSYRLFMSGPLDGGVGC